MDEVSALRTTRLWAVSSSGAGATTCVSGVASRRSGARVASIGTTGAGVDHRVAR